MQKEHFDLLLLDMQMPEMDGFATIKKLRADARWSSFPVIAVSAHNIEADDEKYKRAGYDAFVAKPIDINELMQKIKGLLAVTSNSL